MEWTVFLHGQKRQIGKHLFHLTAVEKFSSSLSFIDREFQLFMCRCRLPKPQQQKGLATRRMND